jgi:oleate hydratase
MTATGKDKQVLSLSLSVRDTRLRLGEVFGSIYDVRELIKSTVFLRDRAKLPVPTFAKRWVEKTIIGRLLEEYGLI